MPIADTDSGSQIHPLAVPMKVATKMVGLSKSTMWPMVMDGTLPSVMVGRRRLILVDGLKEFLNRHLHKAA